MFDLSYDNYRVCGQILGAMVKKYNPLNLAGLICDIGVFGAVAVGLWTLFYVFALFVDCYLLGNC